MAIRILPSDSVGERLGTALGSGIQQALQGLAQQKIRNLLGQQEFSNQNQVASAFEQILQGAQRPSGLEGLMVEEKATTPERQQIDLGLLEKEPPVITKPEEIKEEKKRITPLPPGARASQELVNLDSFLNTSTLSNPEKRRLREDVEKRQEKLLKQQDTIDKKTEGYYSKVTEASEAAISGDMRLDRMEELVRTGRLSSPGTASFLDTLAHAIPVPGTGKSIGINLKGVFLSDEAQEFDKLSKDFLRDVKKFFGARVTQQEVNQFLATIPNLLQSDEGKLRVIRNIKIFNDINKLRKNTMDQIIDQHGGYRPHNIESLTEKAIKPRVDELAKQFKSDIKTSLAIARRSRIEEQGAPRYFQDAPDWLLQRIGIKTS